MVTIRCPAQVSEPTTKQISNHLFTHLPLKYCIRGCHLWLNKCIWGWSTVHTSPPQRLHTRMLFLIEWINVQSDGSRSTWYLNEHGASMKPFDENSQKHGESYDHFSNLNHQVVYSPFSPSKIAYDGQLPFLIEQVNKNILQCTFISFGDWMSIWRTWSLMRMVINKKIPLLPKIKRTQAYAFLFFDERGLKRCQQTP